MSWAKVFTYRVTTKLAEMKNQPSPSISTIVSGLNHRHKAEQIFAREQVVLNTYSNGHLSSSAASLAASSQKQRRPRRVQNTRNFYHFKHVVYSIHQVCRWPEVDPSTITCDKTKFASDEPMSRFCAIKSGSEIERRYILTN